jgi:6-phosphofructokinase
MGWLVMKVDAGYSGLLEGRISPVDRRRLGGIIGRGGTLLGTQRSKESFQGVLDPEGQERVVRRLEEAGAEGADGNRRGG